MLTLALALSTAQAAPSVTLPVPDFAFSEVSCAFGTGPGSALPCFEYEYGVSLVDMRATTALTGLDLRPAGLTAMHADAEITSSVNSAADPYTLHAYTVIGGILTLDQTCSGWVEPFETTTSARVGIHINIWTGQMSISVPPLDAEIALDGNDIMLRGPDCIVGQIDAALGMIPGMDLSIFDFVVDAIVPTLEDMIAGMGPLVEDTVNDIL